MRALRANLELFVHELPTLLPKHEGKFALVCNGVITVFDTAVQATEAAFRFCEDANKFLVIKIESPDKRPFE